MMTRLLMVIALLIVCMQLVAAGYTTPNTGVNWTLDSLLVYSGGTLTGSFPNYILSDTITVAQNDRLSIRPGSAISVAQGTGRGFTVLGVLRAIGTAADTILMKGVVTTAGSHRGFRFEDSAVDSLCVIAYCRMQDAVEAVHCLNANPTIANSLFTNNSSNGVRCFGASPTIQSCTFVENRRNAITANLGSSPLIENSIFARNNSENTSPRNQISIGPQGVNNPIIRNNEVYNLNYFRTGAISLVNVESAGACAALVEGNYLHDNSFGILSQGVNMSPMIRYNRIENSRINPDPFVAGSGISIQVGGATNAPIITGNIIKDNYWGITLVSGSGLTNSPSANIGDLTNADTSDDGWNVFINNNNGGTIYQLYNNGTQSISAQNNYWGSNDSIVVESWITHRPDSAVFGQVNYRPFGIRGLGTPDTLWIQRIVGPEQPTYRLRWLFPMQDSTTSIRVLFGFDSLSLFQVAILSDTATSHIYQTPFQIRHFAGLSSFNRFGESDTVYRRYDPPTHVGTFDIPYRFSLEQNYPNPFNPTTTIRYEVPSESIVRMEIVGILGQRIAVLVDEKQSPGIHTVKWDATRHASGVYFCRMIAGNWTRTIPLILTR